MAHLAHPEVPKPLCSLVANLHRPEDAVDDLPRHLAYSMGCSQGGLRSIGACKTSEAPSAEAKEVAVR